MVYLHQQLASRKRASSFVPPFPPPKIPKSTTTAAVTASTSTAAGAAVTADKTVAAVADVTAASASRSAHGARAYDSAGEISTSKVEKMVTVLAEAGCTLINPSGPPCLPSDTLKFRNRLHRVLSSDSVARDDFLQGFSAYIQSPAIFRRVLMFSNRDGSHANYARSDSLARNLLLVPSIQIDLQNMLLEMLPEHLVKDPGGQGLPYTFEDDIARLILNQFRWLDFHVDSCGFADKLLQVVSICPLHLKKEIIGSLPEMIDDQNNNAIVDSLQQMLQEDPSIVVPVLDSCSNLNLDEQLHDQVITIALSCIRTVEADSMPYLLRFLLLSAKPANVRRIISQIRNQLKFVGTHNAHKLQHSKLKGKLLMDTAEALILDALRSSLRFKNILCEEILKELKSLEKAQDHKVIDIWLLVLISMNGELLKKNVEKIFKRKAVEGSITTALLDQCIRGNRDLVKEYFPSFLSLSENLLSCREQKARELGSYLYVCLFEEFIDTISRQEVIGALIAHLGSGPGIEVNAALDTLLLLASQYPQELLPLSSHINGILDFLEGFSIENLHKVYEVFCHLTLSARCSIDSLGSSIGNELLMIVRKQVGNSDVKYKSMGIIGTLKIVSFLGDSNNCSAPTSSQKSNCEEAIELLKLSLESCKQVPLELVLLYDQLSAVLNSKTLHPGIIEWIGKNLGDFESLFLSDLDGGQLPVQELCGGLEGELWMNLDGDISPVCLNILPLVSSPLQLASILQTLPANFLLVSRLERLANQGSLGGIDALLGCPLYLPSSKYYSGSTWQSLTEKHKEIICLSLYYACNWLRELLNAFCTQVIGRYECTSQMVKEEIVTKLLKRLRNLVYLESLLNHILKQHSFSLPELYFRVEATGFSSQKNHRGYVERKIGHQKAKENNADTNKEKHVKNYQTPTSLDTDAKLQQSTILDAFKKARVVRSRDANQEDSNNLCVKDRKSESAECQLCISDDLTFVEVVGVPTFLESQKSKFRPLSADCHSILTFTKKYSSCCPDPVAELPLHSYLLHDLLNMLDHFSPQSKQFPARCLTTVPGPSRMKMGELLSFVRQLIPNLRKHFDAALSIIRAGTVICEEHWEEQGVLAAHPELIEIKISNSTISGLIASETLSFFSKVLKLSDTQIKISCLFELLEGFQPLNKPASILLDVHPIPLPGTIEYLYCGAYSFLEDALDIACSFSFHLASEVLLTLKSVVLSIQSFPRDSQEKDLNCSGSAIHLLLPVMQKRLGTLSWKLLRHSWDDTNLQNSWKGQGEIIEMILRTYLENSGSTSDAVEELACSVLPQLSAGKATGDDGYHGFPTLTSATFIAWYKTLHEENLNILNKLVRDIQLQNKPRAVIEQQSVEQLLMKLRQSVHVVVSLVNMCRTFEKVTIHAMTVKYTGKFVDSFLRGTLFPLIHHCLDSATNCQHLLFPVFDFLQMHFREHSELILQLVKELQKATRTVQTLCSEAKGSRQMAITGKVPATKRSMERFLFHVKSLLHATSGGSIFWMGNLKHKDLSGQVVSSQAYIDDHGDNDPDPVEVDAEEQHCSLDAEGQ
ncbi:hypothetical protein Dimus_009950 [Dionaea muscipula]